MAFQRGIGHPVEGTAKVPGTFPAIPPEVGVHAEAVFTG